MITISYAVIVVRQKSQELVFNGMCTAYYARMVYDLFQAYCIYTHVSCGSQYHDIDFGPFYKWTHKVQL